MSKELDALKRIYDLIIQRTTPEQSAYIYTGNYKLIENALKDYEKKLAILERLQIILGAETIDGLPDLALKIDNTCYSACYELKQAEKKLKVLEIIRLKNVNVFLLKASFGEVFGFEMYNRNANDLITKEEYDVLKEVLV